MKVYSFGGEAKFMPQLATAQFIVFPLKFSQLLTPTLKCFPNALVNLFASFCCVELHAAIGEQCYSRLSLRIGHLWTPQWYALGWRDPHQRLFVGRPG
jgi:hypothetical protein